MAELTDIHSHLIYGTGDGTASRDESLSVIRMEYSMGMRHQFVTPALDSRPDRETLDVIAERMRELQSAAAAEFPDLTLHLGYTLKPLFDIAAALREGAPLTMGGTQYVLIDPACDACGSLGPVFAELLDAGYIPVIAAPERVKRFRQEPSVLEGYLRQGALLSIDIPSIMGLRGKDAMAFADRLISHRWASFAASDNRRKHFESRLFAGYEHIVAKRSKHRADLMLVENGMKLIKGEPVEHDDPEPWTPGKKTFFGRLFGR
ncbi:MAG: hypothetical protein J5758_04765 [Abditibacteriota bacterium]|nr:hypothetical protein [Abditibacteriota bacterium]